MSRLEKRISAALANGAEYLAMGEIVAHTGMLVSQAPRNNANYDIIVNNHEISKGCRVEVKHSSSGFKANISGREYDYLIFIYAPSKIIDGKIVARAERQIYVFPRKIIDATPRGKTGVNFNPKYIERYEQYLNAFDLILNHLENA